MTNLDDIEITEEVQQELNFLADLWLVDRIDWENIERLVTKENSEESKWN